MAPIVYTSDTTIRQASIERRKVKHCLEVQWISGSKNGGVGFGFDDSYVRFTEMYDYAGSKNVKIIKNPNLKIPMTDSKKGMICLDNSGPYNLFTVIKNNYRRETQFSYPSPFKPIRITLYNGDGATGSDQFFLYTHKYEFENKMPYQYKAWGDELVITCNEKDKILLKKAYVFILLFIPK